MQPHKLTQHDEVLRMAGGGRKYRRTVHRVYPGCVVLDGDLLRAALTRKGLSQAALARGAGAHVNTVSDLMNGRATKLHTAARVVAFIEAQPDVPEYAAVATMLREQPKAGDLLGDIGSAA